MQNKDLQNRMEFFKTTSKRPLLLSYLMVLFSVLLWTSCTKKTEGIITVTTKSVTDITESSAKTGGSVTSFGYSVGDCGVCYGESRNPTLNDNFTKDHEDDGSFSSTLSNLKSGTQYYVRAYAKTSSGIEYGDQEVFTTNSGYTINTFVNPTAGGTMTGAGTYRQGETCTVSATANTGYSFINWTESGTIVSSNESYVFTVTKSRNLQANFSQENHTITVSAEPSDGGVVDGGGEYNHGSSCTVTASALLGYAFTNWTENGQEVSTNASYTFTVTSDRTLVANFSTTVLSGTWLSYDNDEVDGIWGYTNGGTMEWAVMFPSSMLEQYVGMNITAIEVYVGVAGTYDLYFYTGGATPTTEIYSGYSNLNDYGWWTLTLHEPVSVTAQNLWVSLCTTHEAGTYPAGSSVGSNNSNARWINWGSNGWCDAYTAGWSNEDITWNIRAYVTDGDKGREIELSPFAVPSYKHEPTKARFLKEKIKQYGEQRPTKQKRILQGSR